MLPQPLIPQQLSAVVGVLKFYLTFKELLCRIVTIEETMDKRKEATMSEKNTNLMLHCGARRAELDEVATVVTPEPTKSWHPMSHIKYVDMIKNEIKELGYEIEHEEYGLQNGRLYKEEGTVEVPNARLFGVMSLKSDSSKGDRKHSLAVGLRNAHDMTMSMGAFAGSHMFVCDNMAYSGEIAIFKKHTPNNVVEIPTHLANGFSKLPDVGRMQELRFEAYADTQMETPMFHDYACEAVKAGVLPYSKMGYVMEQWENPEHAEFRERNAFSAFNAFTEVAKRTSAFTLPERSRKLHQITDKFCELV